MAEKKAPDKSAVNKILFLAAAVLGILLVAAGGLFSGGSKQTEHYTDVGFYTSYLEEKITALCKSVSGIDDAAVFLTIDGSSEYIYEKSGGSDYLILSGQDGEEAMLLCEIYPRVRGVAIVCTGGEQPAVQKCLTELLCAALDLPANKIRVAGS